jgi:large subunit ribosomal protein L19
MSKIILEIDQKKMKTAAPDVRPGFTVRVHQKIKEGEKERVQVFEGLVIAVGSGEGARKSFTVRKIVDGVGVEKVFPFYSNNIAKIEVKKAAKVRRAKLYYMRDLRGRAARLRDEEIQMREQEIEKEAEKLAEVVEAQEAAEKAAE